MTITVEPDAWGSVEPTNRVRTIQSGSVSYTATPKPGYRFVSWLLDPEYVDNPELYPKGYRSSTLEVKFDASVPSVAIEPNFAYGVYTIAFDAAAGTVSPRSMVVTNSLQGTWPSLPEPKRAGYAFAGWFDGEKEIAAGDDLWLTQNRTLTAKWTPLEFTLSWQPADGIANVSYRRDGQTVFATFSQNGVKVPCGTTFEWYATPKTGYTASPSVGAPGSGKMPAQDVCLTPTATLRQYTVTFDPGTGGTVVGAKTIVVPGTATIWPTLPTATKTGCDFAGWYDGTTRITAGSVLNLSGDKTLTAKWETSDYILSWQPAEGIASVSYRPDGRSVFSTISQSGVKVAYGTAFEWYATPKTGYAASPSVGAPGSGKMPAQDVCLTPTATLRQYTVTFDPGTGGTVVGAKTIVVPGTATTWPTLPTATKTGCDFAGWYDGTTRIMAGSVLNLSGDKTLTAKWEAKEYTLSWQPTDGIQSVSCRRAGQTSYSTISQSGVKVAYGTAFEWYATPKTGYAANPSVGAPGSGKMPAQDVCLTPTATPIRYAVTFDPQDGVVTETSREVAYGAKIGLLPDVSWPKYPSRVFDGWSRYTSGSSRVDENYVCEGAMTLYARWTLKERGTVEVSAEPMTGGNVSGSGTYDDGETVELGAVASEGYGFSQWHDGVKTATRSITVRGGTTEHYTATFTGNVYRVCFDVNQKDATVYPEGKNVIYGKTYGELPTPQCDGYTFIGWYTESLGGTSVDATSFVKTIGAAGVITLYAHWEQIPVYYVAFDGNGATDGSMATQKILRGVSTPLASNLFSRTGYAYSGWTNAVGRSWADGASVLDLAAQNATAKLFAEWTPNNYHVVFDSNGQRGTMSPLMNRVYDVGFVLPSNTYYNLTADFAGWSTNAEADVAEWRDGAAVTNLTTGGTVTLHAVWKSHADELTRAAHGQNVVLQTSGTDPYVAYTNEFGETSAKSGRQVGAYPSPVVMSALTAPVEGPGVLSFTWKSDYPAGIYLYVNGKPLVDATGTRYKTIDGLEGQPLGDGWTRCEWKFSGLIGAHNDFAWKSSWADRQKYVLIDRVIWTPDVNTDNTVCVTFRLNDETAEAEGIWSNATYHVGRPFGSLPQPTSAGYEFVGWSTNVVGEGGMLAETDLVPETDIQAYAQWKESEPVIPPLGASEYAVVYRHGEGRGRAVVQTCQLNKVFGLPTCTFRAPEGKRFVGWVSDTGRRYDSGVLVFNLAVARQSVELTALWE